MREATGLCSAVGGRIQGKGKGEAWTRAKKNVRDRKSRSNIWLGGQGLPNLFTAPHGNLQSRVPPLPWSTTKKTSLIKSQSESTDVITHRSLSLRLHILTRRVCVVFHSDPGSWLRQETQKERNSTSKLGLGSLSVLSGVAIIVPTTTTTHWSSWGFWAEHERCSTFHKSMR